MRQWPWRRYDAYAVVLVFSGSGRYRAPEGTDRALEPGDAILVRPGEPPWYGPDGAHWGELYVVFEGPLFDLLLGAGTPGADAPVRRLEPTATWMARIEELVRAPAADDPVAATQQLLDFAGLLVAMLAGDSDTVAPEADAIATAARMLAADLRAELDLRAVAAQCGLAYETVRKHFTREVGQSPSRYRDERRIEAATDLLADTRLPHRVIAELLGFVDEYHFSKRYRALTGLPPRTVRAGAPR